MTGKMFRCMKHIETTLGIEYKGMDMEDAFKFVAKYKKMSEVVSQISANLSTQDKRLLVNALLSAGDL